MEISSGSRRRARRWSQAIYDAYPQVQDLWYCSSMDANNPVAALYERAEPALRDAHLRFHASLASPALFVALQHAAARFGYALI